MDSKEVRDILVSWAVISFSFGWVMKSAFTSMFAFPKDFAFAIVVAMVAVGSGFILHELSHRALAIRFGAHARYIAWEYGLLFALLLAFGLGFVFAAPGAVYIFGKNINKKKNSLISLAGPITNILVAAFFLAITLLFQKSLVGIVASTAASINLWLATFNLIPIMPLDGAKVYDWNRIVWAILFVPLFLIILFL